MKIKILFVILIVSMFSCKEDVQNTDDKLIKDGSDNVYTQIKIGNQIWLKEDLSCTKYIDGISIPSMYFENKGDAGFYYSGLVDFNKICPKGYRVPTKLDYEVLIAYLGGYDLTENQIIDSYVNKWNGNPNGNGDGVYNQGSGLYWTSSKGDKYGHYYLYFRTINAEISVLKYSFDSFFHIKCIKN